MRWDEFAMAAPELAQMGQARFDDTGLCLVGTLRQDGWPRISPLEPFLVEGELMLGMMWQSRKALDLIRDPRVTVHTTTCDRNGSEGDFKAYGRALDVADPDRRDRYKDALEVKIDWRPPEPFHLFAVDLLSAGYMRFGEGQQALRWTIEGGLQRIRHPND